MFLFNIKNDPFSTSPLPALIVDDEVLTPTYTYDLAKKINELICRNEYGIYHITNNGECSWCGFTRKIFELLNIKTEIVPINTEDFIAQSKGPMAKRPKYSVLKNAHLEKLGMDDLRPWPDALKAYLIEKGHLRPQ